MSILRHSLREWSDHNSIESASMFTCCQRPSSYERSFLNTNEVPRGSRP